MACCPHCHRDNDPDILQCEYCGEILVKEHHGTSWAAILRQVNPGQEPVVSIVPQDYRARSVLRTVKICGWLALAGGVIAGCSAMLAFLYPDHGYNLLEAAIVVGCGAGALLTVAVLIGIFGLALQTLSSALASVRRKPVVPVQKQERERPAARPVIARKPVPKAENPDVPKPSPRQVLNTLTTGVAADLVTILGYVTAIALLSFLLLPQYQVGESFSGWKCVRAIVNGFLELDREYANMEALVVLSIPLLLFTQLILAFLNDTRTMLVTSLTTLGLLLTLYLVNFAKHADAAAQRLLKEPSVLVSFRFGYLVVLLAVLSMTLLLALMAAGGFWKNAVGTAASPERDCRLEVAGK